MDDFARLRAVREAQDELNMLCSLFAQEGHGGVTREDLLAARREIDTCIRAAGFWCGPCEGNTWRPRESLRL